MRKYRMGAYTKIGLKSHIVWIPKYRKPVLTGQVAIRVRDIIRQIAMDHELQIISGKVAKDHVHIFVKRHAIFLSIFLLAFFLRVYKVDTLTTFGGDQGMDFLVASDMVLFHKWTLLGIKTSISPFFQGPLYLYILFPFFILMHLSPIAGAVAAITISMITLVLIYLTGHKYFSKKVALFGSGLFAVSPEFIMYGNTPLYQHFLPIFIVMTFYLFLSRKRTILNTFLLGLSVGLGIELHLLNITLGLALLTYIFVFSKNKIKNSIWFLGGIVVGVLPTIIFELRHQFLNTRLFFNFARSQNANVSIVYIIKQWTEGVSSFLGGNNNFMGIILLVLLIVFLLIKKQTQEKMAEIRRLSLLTLFFIIILGLKFSAFAPHYILPFWVISLFILPLMIEQIAPKKIGIAVMVIVIGINLQSSVTRLNNNRGYTMPDGLSLRKIMQAGRIIAEDSKTHTNFNVASLLDGNTRNYPLRYTTLINSAVPGGVDQYPASNFLYVTARSNQKDLFKTKTWEIISLSPFRIGRKWNLGDNVYLYRIDRNIKKSY